MTREQLRAALLADNDQLRNSWIAWRTLTPEQRNRAIASRQFWAADNATTDAALDAFAAIVSTMQAHPPMTEGTLDDLESYAAALWQLLRSAHSFGDAVKLIAALIVMALGDRQPQSKGE